MNKLFIVCTVVLQTKNVAGTYQEASKIHKLAIIGCCRDKEILYFKVCALTFTYLGRYSVV